MTTITTTPVIKGDAMLAVARNLGEAIAPYASGHEDDGSFVVEGFELLRASGFLAAPVPEPLGGGGATTEQVAWAQYELARFCSSTALASTMHLHAVLTTAWRWRAGLPGAERLLRRVAEEGLVVASTGGGDFTIPSGSARRVAGGWEISGRKGFVSGAPAADVAATWAVTDEGEAIGFGVDLHHPSVTVVETWDAPGMRGTASHDVVLDRYLVADEQVTARRVPGQFAPVLAIIAAKALPVIAATYLGVANGARDEVVRRLASTERADDPGVRRTIGLMDEHLSSGRWALGGALASLGDDPAPTVETLTTGALVKKTVTEHARAVGDLAMDVVGGRAYRRMDAVARAWRDVRAGPFHPIEHELTLRLVGDLALGRPAVLR